MAGKRGQVRVQREKAHHRFIDNPFVLRLYPFVILTVLGIVIYSNSFNCSFHFDDLSNIENNESIRTIHNLKAIWNFSYHSKMRFLGYLTFALDYHFHENSFFGYHLVNLGIHITASFLVWWMVVLILSTPAMRDRDIGIHKKLAALGCALIFLSHPVQTQAVTYIVQRFASLASMLYLLSLCLYLKARMIPDYLFGDNYPPVKRESRGGKAVLFFCLAAVSALAGFFAKEIVLTLPLAVLLFEFGFIRPSKPGGCALLSPINYSGMNPKSLSFPRSSPGLTGGRGTAIFILIGFVIPAILLYRSVIETGFKPVFTAQHTTRRG